MNTLKHKLSILVCLVCLSPTLASCQTKQPAPLALDKRITGSATYQQLLEPDLWEQGIVPSDTNQQPHGCQTVISNTPGGYDALRAANLAATGHFDEAINEWTVAIKNYDQNNVAAGNMLLDPNWLISRARLYIKLGRTNEAAADLERAVKLKRCYDQEKFKIALLYMQLSNFDRAESILTEMNAAMPLFRPYIQYILAKSRQEQGKSAQARQDYLDAATMLAATGNTPACNQCLEEIAAIDATTDQSKTKLSIKDLTPPRDNYQKIRALFVALATSPNIFDMDKLKTLIGASTIMETSTSYLVMPFKGHYKQLSLVTIDKLQTGGKRLTIHMEPVLCSIDSNSLKDVLSKPIESPQILRKEVGHTEAYKVPSGTLVLSILDGGFNSIWWVQLYSKDAVYPEKRNDAEVKHDALEKAHIRARACEHLDTGNIAYVQKIATEWTKEEPENPRAHLLQAQIFAKKGELDQALSAIDLAIKYGPSDKLLYSTHSGDALLIQKGTYQLDKGMFAEAYASFNKAFPAQPWAEHLLLRARAEIGLKMTSAARNDLKQASSMFWQQGRIVKRDEVEKLLQSL